MLIVFSVIGALILTAGIVIYSKYGATLYGDDKEWVYYLLNALGAIILCISIFLLIIVGGIYSKHITIDDEIDLYRSENSKIEQQMSVIVSNYMEYESNTFENLKNESPIVLVSLYPELKSNELVSKQIDIHVTNNAIIKQLECERLEYRILAWWLFFGG